MSKSDEYKKEYFRVMNVLGGMGYSTFYDEFQNKTNLTKLDNRGFSITVGYFSEGKWVLSKEEAELVAKYGK